tara:strand:+ start:5115 stop:5453 length:339 start_codon:yes stop_codon:yes gene_type:complete
MKKLSELEETLWVHMRAMHGDCGMPMPERQFHYLPDRPRCHCDFCWPDQMLIVEAEGGVWNQGRHTRGKGFIDDCTKYNEASLLGYTVLRVTMEHISSGQAIEWIMRFLEDK